MGHHANLTRHPGAAYCRQRIQSTIQFCLGACLVFVPRLGADQVGQLDALGSQC